MRRLSTQLEEKYSAETTPIVNAPLRVVVSTSETSVAMGPATSLGQASKRICATWSDSSLVPKKPAKAATTIRNGNNDISVESAMWLAIAHPSSTRKRMKAS